MSLHVCYVSRWIDFDKICAGRKINYSCSLLDSVQTLVVLPLIIAEADLGRAKTSFWKMFLVLLKFLSFLWVFYFSVQRRPDTKFWPRKNILHTLLRVTSLSISSSICSGSDCCRCIAISVVVSLVVSVKKEQNSYHTCNKSSDYSDAYAWSINSLNTCMNVLGVFQVNVVEAFDQSLCNMSRRLQRLTLSSSLNVRYSHLPHTIFSCGFLDHELITYRYSSCSFFLFKTP